ncbi:MAG TPA: glycosyltransferase family 4 protein [Actinomycetes bacterium]
MTGHRSGRPHVLIIVENSPVPRDRRVWRQSQALRRAGYAVSVICPNGGDEPRTEERDGVRIHRWGPVREARGKAGFVREYLHAFVATALLTVRILVREGVDVVQACNPPDVFFPIGALVRLAGGRFVFDQHDLAPELYAARFGRDRGVLPAVLRGLERATFLAADHVIANNDFYREVALGRGGQSAARVTVVRNGPELAVARRVAPRPELRQGRRFLACYVGLMGPQDGIDLALDAAAYLIGDLGRTDCHFAFLGAGESLAELRRHAARLGIEPWVSFPGFVDEPALAGYLSSADVGLCPDRLDAFSDTSTMMKTLDYMAFGLPVVAFDLAETRASAGPAGAYVPSGDVAAFARLVDELLRDPERRAAMGAAGRRRVEESLAWDHQEPAYLEVFRRLLPEGLPGARQAQA